MTFAMLIGGFLLMLDASRIDTGGGQYQMGINAPTPTFYPDRIDESVSERQGALGYVLLVTPTPQVGVKPTPTPEFVPEKKEFLLSFYDPMIGQYFPDIASINCDDWRPATSYQNAYCASMTASGEDWRDWYGRGLACPPGYELWTVFEVFQPELLRGDWTCIDRGYGVEGQYLDFLLPFPDHEIFEQTGWNLNFFPWRELVIAVVHPPGTYQPSQNLPLPPVKQYPNILE
jgi:hypothetical protein